MSGVKQFVGKNRKIRIADRAKNFCCWHVTPPAVRCGRSLPVLLSLGAFAPGAQRPSAAGGRNKNSRWRRLRGLVRLGCVGCACVRSFFYLSGLMQRLMFILLFFCWHFSGMPYKINTSRAALRPRMEP